MEKIQTAIIGGGVIGLSIARRLSEQPHLFHDIILLEAESTLGSITSSRNSEVIHAGIYYPTSSLKHTYCLKGRNALYNYCTKHNIPFQKCGKLIVMTDVTQQRKLLDLYNQGLKNGVDDLKLLASEDVKYLEPNVQCYNSKNVAILSPSTGILDSHSFLLSLAAEAEENGVMISCNSSVTNAKLTNDGIQLTINNNEIDLLCNYVINCAGLSSHTIANMILGENKMRKQYYAKGNYYKLHGQKSPFHHLIYPLPDMDGLGIHATNDLHGYCRFGPDVQWLDPSTKKVEYTVDDESKVVFYNQIKKYYPSITLDTLVADYSGVRPKLYHPDVENGGMYYGSRDFVIDGPDEHDAEGLINLLGIESPGLTSNFAIADAVCDILSR